jgi:hypothetical protein
MNMPATGLYSFLSLLPDFNSSQFGESQNPAAERRGQADTRTRTLFIFSSSLNVKEQPF